MKLNTLDEVAQLVGAVDAAFPASAGWGDLTLFKVDMAKAYKQAPVHPDDRHELVIGVRDPAGKVCYFTHNVLPFGASAAPFQFARLAHAVVSVARGLFRLPIQNYLGDFWGIVPGEVAEEAFQTFCFLFSLLGFRLKEKKKLGPTTQGALLGVEADLRGRSLSF